MGNLFSYEGPLISFLERLADLLILNLIFIICCIPVFTAGAALTALSTITRKMAGKEEGYILRGYFKAFKENFLQATAIWLILLFFALVFVTDLLVLLKYGTGGIFFLLWCLTFPAGLMWLFVFVYVFPLLARFDNTIKNTLKNALLLSIRFLPWTVVLLLLMVLPFLAGFFYPLIGIPFYLFMGFSLISLASSYIFRKLFERL
ncbi:MAG: YesL family protein [Lachnospiraceae bacterium]|nr:YesL family protein [Lachnospiraceae bacterium]